MHTWEKEINVQCLKEFAIGIGVSIVGGFSLAAVGAVAIKSLTEQHQKELEQPCLIKTGINTAPPLSPQS